MELPSPFKYFCILCGFLWNLASQLSLSKNIKKKNVLFSRNAILLSQNYTTNLRLIFKPLGNTLASESQGFFMYKRTTVTNGIFMLVCQIVKEPTQAAFLV